MKRIKLLFILYLFTNIMCQAQFPAPRSFEMSYNYIYIDSDGWCNYEPVRGATYCTSFQWEAPDLSETEAQLTGYKVYYEGMEGPFSEVVIIAQTTNTYLEMELGITGTTWVTAVYSNPEGESEPSNIASNDRLPIAIEKVERPLFSMTYNKQKNGIEIDGIEDIAFLRIFRLDGSIVPVSTSDFHFIDIEGIEKGVYIVKIATKDTKIIIEKLVIE